MQSCQIVTQGDQAHAERSGSLVVAYVCEPAFMCKFEYGTEHYGSTLLIELKRIHPSDPSIHPSIKCPYQNKNDNGKNKARDEGSMLLRFYLLEND